MCENTESFLTSHIELSKHISRGVLERDIEFHYSDLSEELIVYCSDGLRSTLAADALLKMGYSNVRVMEGGFQAWKKGRREDLLGITLVPSRHKMVTEHSRFNTI